MKHTLFKAESRRRQRGFSLLEVMVAVGVAAALGYAVTQMMVNSGKQAAGVTSKTDFNSFVTELQGTFNNTQNCVVAFGNKDGTKFPETASTTLPFDVPKLHVGNTDFMVGTTFGGPAAVAGQTGTSKRTMKITKIQITGMTLTSVTDQYVVPVLVEATRATPTENAVGGNLLSHTFNLIVNVKLVTPITSPKQYSIQSCAGMYNDFWTASSDPNGIIYTGGNVGIGKNNVDPPQAKLDVDGSIEAKMFLVRSDARLKENVRNIPSALDRLLRLRGVRFDWKDPEGLPKATDQLGFLAQEVEQVFPEAVITSSGTGLKSVGYGTLVAPLVEAFKEQQAIIERQEREIAALRQAIRSQR